VQIAVGLTGRGRVRSRGARRRGTAAGAISS